MTNFPNRGFYRGDVNAMLADHAKHGTFIAPHAPERGPTIGFHAQIDVSATLLEPPQPMGKSEARASGYTGEQCTNCNSMKMRVSGHCQCCDDCGTTTGCS